MMDDTKWLSDPDTSAWIYNLSRFSFGFDFQGYTWIMERLAIEIEIEMLLQALHSFPLIVESL